MLAASYLYIGRLTGFDFSTRNRALTISGKTIGGETQFGGAMTIYADTIKCAETMTFRTNVQITFSDCHATNIRRKYFPKIFS